MGAISAEPAGGMARLPSSGDLTIAAAADGAPFLRHRGAALITGIALAAIAATAYSSVGDRAIAAFIAFVLVVVAATDLERRIIPNRIIVPALGIVLVARIATSPTPRWGLAALGAALLFFLPNLIDSSAMGMGDVKLAAFLGAGLGTGVIGALLVAFLCSAPFALAALIRGGLAARKSTLPFGPFLACGGLVVLIIPPLLGLGGG